MLRPLIENIAQESESAQRLLELCIRPLLLCLHMPALVQQATTLLLQIVFFSSTCELFIQLITVSELMFQIFQEAILKNKDSDDLIIILQKITSKEPTIVESLLSVKTIEMLHSEMDRRDDFVKQNIKSILRLITD